MLEEIWRRWTLWNLFRRVRRSGWTGVHVPGDAETASLSYSLGFWRSAQAPEIVFFGVDAHTANALLHEAYAQLTAGELAFADKGSWTLEGEEGANIQLAWRKVHPSQIRRQHFNAAIIYNERQGRGRSELEAYQLFFPDTGGRFPWEDGFDTAYKPRQPELYLPYFGPDRD